MLIEVKTFSLYQFRLIDIGYIDYYRLISVIGLSINYVYQSSPSRPPAFFLRFLYSFSLVQAGKTHGQTKNFRALARRWGFPTNPFF